MVNIDIATRLAEALHIQKTVHLSLSFPAKTCKASGRHTIKADH